MREARENYRVAGLGQIGAWDDRRPLPQRFPIDRKHFGVPARRRHAATVLLVALAWREPSSFIQKSDCSGAAEQTCEHLRGANARQKTDIDLGLAEAKLSRRKAKVAMERDLKASAHGRAVDGGAS